jgi:hypothetical protein
MAPLTGAERQTFLDFLSRVLSKATEATHGPATVGAGHVKSRVERYLPILMASVQRSRENALRQARPRPGVDVRCSIAFCCATLVHTYLASEN